VRLNLYWFRVFDYLHQREYLILLS
jgi:hypothetical protein